MGACSRPITSFLNVRLIWTYGCYYSKHILDVKCLFPRLEYMDRNVTKARTAAEGMHEQRPSRRYLGLGLAVSDCCLRGAGARNVSRPVLRQIPSPVCGKPGNERRLRNRALFCSSGCDQPASMDAKARPICAVIVGTQLPKSVPTRARAEWNHKAGWRRIFI